MWLNASIRCCVYLVQYNLRGATDDTPHDFICILNHTNREVLLRVNQKSSEGVQRLVSELRSIQGGSNRNF